MRATTRKMEMVVKVYIYESAWPTAAVAVAVMERDWKLMIDWLTRAKRKRRNNAGITMNIIRKVP